jgi:hypothetical protein
MKKQLQHFINAGRTGSMTAAIGQSQWWYERKRSALGVTASITEKVGDTTLNAIFDGTPEECLALFLERAAES